MIDLEPVPLSALSQYAYCPRRCALIHLDQTWADNVYTTRGTRLHERADTLEYEVQDGVRIERALSLWNDRLGLIGRADIVEFHPLEGIGNVPYPVEYKAGKRKPTIKVHANLDLSKHVDDVQLCAQAMCLEEMFGTTVPTGAIFHHASRRRREVRFDPELRALTEHAIHAVRTLLYDNTTPPEPVNDARCEHCSLRQACQPDLSCVRFDPYALEAGAIPPEDIREAT